MVCSCFRLVAAALLALHASAQDVTGVLSMGGGGGLDLEGLQDSLKDGGVEGLNKMLKAMAGGMRGANDASAHLTKDASGNAMYDFRDIGAGPPKPALVAQTPALKDLAPVADGAPPTPRTELTVKAPETQGAGQALLAAAAAPDDALPMPDFGIVEPVRVHKAGATFVAAKAAITAPVALHDQVPSSQGDDDDDDDDEEAPASPVQKSPLIVWGATNIGKDTLGHAPPVIPAAPATAVVVANGLGAMRQNVDTLLGKVDVMLHARPQQDTPAPAIALANAGMVGADSTDGVEILRRLKAIEDENVSLRSEESAQALRLQVVERKEQERGAELNMVEQENAKLRNQMKASQGATFLEDKKAVRTFFHKKTKLHHH